MDEEDKRNYRQADANSNYKFLENASFTFWAVLILYSIFTYFSFGAVACTITTLLMFLLSFWWKTRFIVYAFVILTPLIYGLNAAGFPGMGRGSIFSVILVIICWLNYDYGKLERDIEK